MGAIFNFYFLIFNFISLHNSLDFLERERERETQAYIVYFSARVTYA